MRRLAKLARWGGVAALVLSPVLVLAAYVLDRGYGVEVTLYTPAAPEIVAVERSLWLPGDSVAAIYGVPAGSPMRVVLTDESRLVRPVEDPSLVLLPVDKQRGENPLQVQTVWFLAWRLAGGLLAGGLLALGLGRWLGRRVASPSAGPRVVRA